METQYIYRLGEFKGSCLLELRVGTDTTVSKFSRTDSLYILDDAFYRVLESLFRLVVQDFDMFEDTVIDKRQWEKIRELDIAAGSVNILSQIWFAVSGINEVSQQ